MSNINTLGIDDNIKNMTRAMERIHSGQITEAVRDTFLDGFDIKTGDMLCIYDGDIAIVTNDLQSATRKLADHMLSFGGEVVTIYYGENISLAQAEELSDYIQSKYSDVEEVEIYHSNQPLYSFIISVE